MFHLFFAFERRQKRVFHRICCLSILAFFASTFPFSSRSDGLFITLESVFLVLFAIKLNFFLSCRGWNIYYNDFLWAFVVYGFGCALFSPFSTKRFQIFMVFSPFAAPNKHSREDKSIATIFRACIFTIR